ncbi:hypothetical protein [Roseovarius sp.]|uniref:hypothetical protein n=1 Tax=Roseovarius sp. TaxID=1486281 RepID=UPI003BABCACA
MRNANWKNSDKYFHCKANCEAAREKFCPTDDGGEYMAEKLSNLREIFDQRLKGDTLAQSLADQAANRWGRQNSDSVDFTCADVCGRYRPAGLPGQY